MKSRIGVATVALALLLLALPSGRPNGQQSGPDLPAKLWKITVDLRADEEFGTQSGTADFHRDGIAIVTLADGVSKVPGVWRLKDGDRGVSSTFELQCDPGDPCGTLILRGDPDGHGGFAGKVIEISGIGIGASSQRLADLDAFIGTFTMVPK